MKTINLEQIKKATIKWLKSEPLANDPDDVLEYYELVISKVKKAKTFEQVANAMDDFDDAFDEIVWILLFKLK